MDSFLGQSVGVHERPDCQVIFSGDREKIQGLYGQFSRWLDNYVAEDGTYDGETLF